ncbi:hypothetical protein CcrC1_gp539 [Caulobacter phage C1]|nr:hypothetical protein CcrC1_gp046 [Caulobacter phage C1]UTU08273.1 hypothetical protein CcrC2_gp045 [Caulobacter phage C2]UTU08796.1 hypothetical protein CcrJ4_gp045 [Caulobacter phage J4]UTU09336.1 hypothetical protein CcrBL47_gp050 [Caulobacter phage BL47]UTU09908.1 hypothetical protein CcrRB23_gp046 [Caulobacter phage RB23]WGN96933.1 hypothetical protein [Bertelyvirus sp.]
MSFRLALTEDARFTAARGAVRTVREQARPAPHKDIDGKALLAPASALDRIRAVLGN